MRPPQLLPVLFFLLLSVTSSVHARLDAKRALASSLIRRADSHKERSLRDVLSEHDRDFTAPPPSRNSHNVHRRDEATSAQSSRFPAQHVRTNFHTTDMPHQTRTQTAPTRPRTLSELFAWAISVTARSVNTTRPAIPPSDTPTSETRAIPQTLRSPTTPVSIPLSPSESESETLHRSVRLLLRGQPSTRAAALLTVEELCHSVDNGRDLQSSGGVVLIAHALRDPVSRVRASAAWALATCAQNNPVVQNASVTSGAVPTLAYLAAHDAVALVRSRALFALNAVLELPAARAAFEGGADAVPAVRRALLDRSDRRAVRRALNLAELLVGKNLDVWKTELEAWDIPQLIERLMREHRDIDVRESAARVIAALDGRVLS